MVGFVAGLLTSAFVKIAGDKLSSALAEQAGLVWNFRKDLVDMKATMESMAAVLKDAEQQSVRKESVRLWLKRLKDAALDISDMMDDYQDPETRTTEKMPGTFSFLTAARKKQDLAIKMKNMRKKLRKINEDGQNFNFTLSTGANLEQQHYNPRETTSEVNEAKIFGRAEEKKEIIDILSASHNQDGTMVLPIYGLGGTGKSTLAQLVYNDAQFKQYDHRVWVYVSEVFDLKKIGTSIIAQLSTRDQLNRDALHKVYWLLDELLPGKKVLIVLDDIWEENVLELEKLKAMLHVDKKDSMVDVIVTTRHESIANKICTNRPHKLQPLKDDVCWDIIKRYSGFEGKANKEEMEKIGLEIAKKCGGMALAAQALGYMLKSKDLHGWLETSNSDIWNESFEVDDPQHKNVLRSLKLSYEQMLPILRLCFSYCAIFPKGHGIHEDDLVHQWVALDFIKKPSEGKECIKQLLGISFLQHSNLPSTSVKHVMRYTMHDLVHDLARSVIGDELIVIDAANKSNSTSEQKYHRFALLTNYDGQTNLSNILPKKVRAFHFSSSSKLRLHDGSFSFAKCLRILHFSGCPDIILPSSIGQLNQLRCLIAPNVQNERLPEALTELSKLQYLNLRLVGWSGILKVPKSLCGLKSLVHLDMSGFSGITVLPESLGGLKSLVHLHMSRCYGITVLPESLGGLKYLEHLDMSNCSRITVLPESLGELKSLEHLDMSGCSGITILPESLGGVKSLVHLDMSGCSRITVLPNSLGELKYLVHLDMSCCDGITVLPESFGGLKSLVHLKMSYCSRISVLPESLGGLKSLEHLEMSRCYGITVLPESLGGLRNLEHLDMSNCSGITVLPESLGELKSLVHLKMSGCFRITVLPESLGGLKSLEHLDMSGCSEITVLPESLGGLKSLVHLNMSYCYGITVLPESLGGLKSLVHLHMSHCYGGGGKDAKMVLPQPTPQQMQMKGMKLPPRFMGSKMPFPAPCKDPKFVKLLPEDEFEDFDAVYAELDVLDHRIDNGNEKPNKLNLPILQRITENFSDKLRIGDGGCGEVYKGILPNRVIAVKRLFNRHTIDDKMFHQEVKSMMMVKHKNTVRLLGYCSHTEEEAVEIAGETIIAQIRERLLCFEYISHGSLKNQIADELRGLEWHTRYQIIKGICEGLHHLHKEKQIIHMDLKPDNILLDEHMVPKITDFGLSRFDDKSQTTSVERLFTMGYCAPEYLHDGKRSPKSDIYSLGVIILELVTGSKENRSITKILRRWKHRWNKSAMATTLEYKQVATSLDVARRCMQSVPADRPNIWDILSDLNKLDTANVHISGVTEYPDLEDMLGIEPLEMHLPIELNKEISFSIELTNDTNDYFAFRISTTSVRPYRVPDKDIVPPRSKSSVTIALQALENAPPHNYRKDEFSVQSTRVDKSFTTMGIAGVLFNEDHGKVVDEVNVMIILDAP